MCTYIIILSDKKDIQRFKIFHILLHSDNLENGK